MYIKEREVSPINLFSLKRTKANTDLSATALKCRNFFLCNQQKAGGLQRHHHRHQKEVVKMARETSDTKKRVASANNSFKEMKTKECQFCFVFRMGGSWSCALPILAGCTDRYTSLVYTLRLITCIAVS